MSDGGSSVVEGPRLQRDPVDNEKLVVVDCIPLVKSNGDTSALEYAYLGVLVMGCFPVCNNPDFDPAMSGGLYRDSARSRSVNS